MISTWINRLSKEDCLLWSRWASSNPLSTWIEPKRQSRGKFSFCLSRDIYHLLPSYWVLLGLWPQSRSGIYNIGSSGFQTLKFGLELPTSYSGLPSCQLQNLRFHSHVSQFLIINLFLYISKYIDFLLVVSEEPSLIQEGYPKILYPNFAHGNLLYLLYFLLDASCSPCYTKKDLPYIEKFLSAPPNLFCLYSLFCCIKSSMGFHACWILSASAHRKL